MSFVPPKDRVFEQSTSNSQTVFTVTGALDASYNAFSASMSVGDTTIGAVVELGVAFKTGLLTYSATNQVTVTTVYESKGTFSSGGVKQVFMGQPAAATLMLNGPQTLTAAQKAQAAANLFKGPTTQVFTSGSGTYTTPADALWIEVELIGAGGGGSGSGTSAGAGGAGGSTTFSTLTGGGGSGGGATGGGGAGGTATGGFTNKPGASGGNGAASTNQWGGFGAPSPYGGGGLPGQPNQSAGGAAPANSGSGGGGGGDGATINSGGGGGAGGFVRAIINSPAATYSYAIGAGGTVGTAGTGGSAGGLGGSGYIQVTEHYS